MKLEPWSEREEQEVSRGGLSGRAGGSAGGTSALAGHTHTHTHHPSGLHSPGPALREPSDLNRRRPRHLPALPLPPGWGLNVPLSWVSVVAPGTSWLLLSLRETVTGTAKPGEGTKVLMGTRKSASAPGLGPGPALGDPCEHVPHAVSPGMFPGSWAGGRRLHKVTPFWAN